MTSLSIASFTINRLNMVINGLRKRTAYCNKQTMVEEECSHVKWKKKCESMIRRVDYESCRNRRIGTFGIIHEMTFQLWLPDQLSNNRLWPYGLCLLVRWDNGCLRKNLAKIKIHKTDEL